MVYLPQLYYCTGPCIPATHVYPSVHVAPDSTTPPLSPPSAFPPNTIVRLRLLQRMPSSVALGEALSVHIENYIAVQHLLLYLSICSITEQTNSM